MDIKTTAGYLTNRDLERLKEIRKYVLEGVACTYEKQRVLECLEAVINPKCAVCRKPLSGDVIIVNDHKMHSVCRGKYRG